MRRKAKPVPLAPSWEGGKAGGGEVPKRAGGRRGCLDLSGLVISCRCFSDKKIKENYYPGNFHTCWIDGSRWMGWSTMQVDQVG